ncbi:MAG: cyclase family protein [Bdellovibrionales bacterium]|nr:cyclase family protein [Bdellovibrionales bacterium]
MADFFDITPKISPRLAVFPGDQPFERKIALSFAQGHHLELSAMLATLHLGAHADAPSHYGARGVSIDKRSPGLYMGRAQVVRVSGLAPKARVMPRDFDTPVQAPRVLLDTGSFVDPDHWNPHFNSYSPELLSWLADQGVKLVGIDTPSVDPEDSKALESHQILRQRDLAVLEGLLLKNVPEGIYTLIALPLAIEGGDASPVRAVLLPEVKDFPELA